MLAKEWWRICWEHEGVGWWVKGGLVTSMDSWWGAFEGGC